MCRWRTSTAAVLASGLVVRIGGWLRDASDRPSSNVRARGSSVARTHNEAGPSDHVVATEASDTEVVLHAFAARLAHDELALEQRLGEEHRPASAVRSTGTSRTSTLPPPRASATSAELISTALAARRGAGAGSERWTAHIWHIGQRQAPAAAGADAGVRG